MIGISRRTVFPAGGLRIVEDPHLVDMVEDWSEVRSRSRAERRRRQGHPQRVRYVERPKTEMFRTGDVLIGHPETIKALYRGMDEKLRQKFEDDLMRTLLGGPLCPETKRPGAFTMSAFGTIDTGRHS